MTGRRLSGHEELESSMSRELHIQATPLAEDFEPGDDGDLPGLDQPVTSDDIAAIVGSSRISSQAKSAMLQQIRDDLQTRDRLEQRGELDGLIGEVEAGLRAVDQSGDGIGTPAAYGFDAETRVLQPDEILERAEEEQPDSDES
jgi:hypothetical protein